MFQFHFVERTVLGRSTDDDALYSHALTRTPTLTQSLMCVTVLLVSLYLCSYSVVSTNFPVFSVLHVSCCSLPAAIGVINGSYDVFLLTYLLTC